MPMPPDFSAVHAEKTQPGPAPEPHAEPPALPDEDTFTPPPAWARKAEPFRGRRPAADLRVERDTVAAGAEQLRRRLDPEVRKLLDHPSSDPALVERAALHAGTSGGLLR